MIRFLPFSDPILLSTSANCRVAHEQEMTNTQKPSLHSRRQEITEMQSACEYNDSFSEHMDGSSSVTKAIVHTASVSRNIKSVNCRGSLPISIYAY